MDREGAGLMRRPSYHCRLKKLELCSDGTQRGTSRQRFSGPWPGTASGITIKTPKCWNSPLPKSTNIPRQPNPKTSIGPSNELFSVTIRPSNDPTLPVTAAVTHLLRVCYGSDLSFAPILPMCYGCYGSRGGKGVQLYPCYGSAVQKRAKPSPNTFFHFLTLSDTFSGISGEAPAKNTNSE